MNPALRKKLAAEFLGTGLLVAAVVGSGIMAERLAGGNSALALLANTIATGCALVALILVFGPISGAHFNPAVSIASAAERKMRWRDAGLYSAAQLCGGIGGTILAHAMFGMALVNASQHARSGGSQWLSEYVATFGLLLVIAACSRTQPQAVPYAVACWIVAAYWFTASTSFANPAVTVARSWTNTFSGIRQQDVPAFVVAQICGALTAILFFRAIVGKNSDENRVPER